VKRRAFITLLGGAAAWPLTARALQSAKPLIGFLYSLPPYAIADRLRAFRQGLKETGYVEGQNVAIEYRSFEGQTDRLPLLVADLLRRQVAVIIGNTPSALAAKAAPTTVPIVFVTGGDPVRDGLVANLNRPGGNVTGVSFMSVDLAAKQLGLLRELRPGAARIGLLVDPKMAPYRAVCLTSPGCGFDHGAANRRPLRQQRPRDRDRLYNTSWVRSAPLRSAAQRAPGARGRRGPRDGRTGCQKC